MMASSAFLISRCLKSLLLLATIERKENAVLSLNRSTLLASNRYNPGRKRMNFITCSSEICTENAFSISVSRVTRYFSLTRARDKMLAKQFGLYHTWKLPNRPFWSESRMPPEVCIRNNSPSVVVATSVNNFLLRKICSVDSLSRRIQLGLM